MKSSTYADILKRIEAGIEAARTVFARFTPGAIETEYKIGHDPVTEADRAIDTVLRQNLLRDGEGWLSEETVDDLSRLDKSRVWVVDPLDGTREFVQGIPEFCVSIAYVENGRPVAGGICNPATNERVAHPGQPQRGETRRVAAISGWRISDSSNGLSCVQTRPGFRRAGGRYVYADTEERVGRGGGCGSSRQCGRLRQHTGKYSAAMQSQESVADRITGKRSIAERRTARRGAISSAGFS